MLYEPVTFITLAVFSICVFFISCTIQFIIPRFRRIDADTSTTLYTDHTPAPGHTSSTHSV